MEAIGVEQAGGLSSLASPFQSFVLLHVPDLFLSGMSLVVISLGSLEELRHFSASEVGMVPQVLSETIVFLRFLHRWR